MGSHGFGKGMIRISVAWFAPISQAIGDREILFESFQRKTLRIQKIYDESYRAIRAIVCLACG